MDPTFLALSVGLPLAVASALVALAFLARRGAAWASLLAVSLAFLIGAPVIIGRWPEWRPTQAADWLPYLGILAAVIGAADLALPRSRMASAGLVALLAAAAFGAYLGPLESASRRYMGEGAEKQLWISAVFALLIVPGLAARAGARRTPNAGPVFALGLLTAATIAAAFIDGILKFAQFASLLGLGLLPIGAATLLRRPWPIDRGAIVVFSFLHALLWLLTRFYGQAAPTSAAVLGAAAPAAMLIARIPALSARPKTAGIAQAVAVAALGAAALALTIAAHRASTGQ